MHFVTDIAAPTMTGVQSALALTPEAVLEADLPIGAREKQTITARGHGRGLEMDIYTLQDVV